MCPLFHVMRTVGESSPSEVRALTRAGAASDWCDTHGDEDDSMEEFEIVVVDADGVRETFTVTPMRRLHCR